MSILEALYDMSKRNEGCTVTVTLSHLETFNQIKKEFDNLVPMFFSKQ